LAIVNQADTQVLLATGQKVTINATYSSEQRCPVLHFKKKWGVVDPFHINGYAIIIALSRFQR
jgi:hypothetical protein